jgi:hypothetical protein
MHVFLDFEASSLNDDSYPIEVGWAYEDGRTESWLIRPAEGWTDWSSKAEAIHGITRETLATDGTDHAEVARHLLDTLAEHEVYASAPSWDGKWLSVLLRGAGLPRHAMRLKDTDEAQCETARRILGPAVHPHELNAAVRRVVSQVREAASKERVKHRALDDALQEMEIWRQVGRAAEEEVRRRVAQRSLRT